MQFNTLLCFQQLISTTSFKSNQTNKTFKIYHKVNCKSSFVIYLLENNYETISATFNTMINQNHHSILASITIEIMSKVPMQYYLANISTDTIMTLIIKQIHDHRATKKSTETLKERLKQRENFWIMKRETLALYCLNQDLK